MIPSSPSSSFQKIENLETPSPGVSLATKAGYAFITAVALTALTGGTLALVMLNLTAPLFIAAVATTAAGGVAVSGLGYKAITWIQKNNKNNSTPSEPTTKKKAVVASFETSLAKPKTVVRTAPVAKDSMEAKSDTPTLLRPTPEEAYELSSVASSPASSVASSPVSEEPVPPPIVLPILTEQETNELSSVASSPASSVASSPVSSVASSPASSVASSPVSEEPVEETEERVLPIATSAVDFVEETEKAVPTAAEDLEDNNVDSAVLNNVASNSKTLRNMAYTLASFALPALGYTAYSYATAATAAAELG